MGPPLLIGAGLGAITSAAMGKNPFMGALLGGATGGAFGGAGGFGSGFAGDAGGLLSNVQGVATAPVSLGTGGFASGIGGQVIPSAASSAIPAGFTATNGEIGSNLLSGNGITTASGQVASGSIPLTTMDKVGNYISNIPSNAMDYVKNNPLSSAKMALDVATPPPEAPMQDRSTPVKQGNPSMLIAPNWNTNPSSNLDTNLQIGQTKDNRMGLLDALKTRIPLTDEEKAQLARLNQRY